MKKIVIAALVIGLLSGCSGIRRQNDIYTAHAEAFHIFGFTVPEDDQAKARSLVPAGADIRTLSSSPTDWTSVLGVLTNIFGFSVTEISGKTPQ